MKRPLNMTVEDMVKTFPPETVMNSIGKVMSDQVIRSINGPDMKIHKAVKIYKNMPPDSDGFNEEFHTDLEITERICKLFDNLREGLRQVHMDFPDSVTAVKMDLDTGEVTSKEPGEAL